MILTLNITKFLELLRVKRARDLRAVGAKIPERQNYIIKKPSRQI